MSGNFSSQNKESLLLVHLKIFLKYRNWIWHWGLGMFTNGPFFRVFVVMFTLQESWIRSYNEISAQKLCKVTSNEQSRNFEILESESFSFKRRTVHTTYLQFDTSFIPSRAKHHRSPTNPALRINTPKSISKFTSRSHPGSVLNFACHATNGMRLLIERSVISWTSERKWMYSQCSFIQSYHFTRNMLWTSQGVKLILRIEL